MNRRDFITCAGAAGLAVTCLRGAASEEKEPLFEELIRLNDALLEKLLARQEKRVGHRWFGGIPNEHGMHTAGGTAQLVKAIASAVCAAGSVHFGSARLAEPVQLALRYLRAAQHEDGTIDLLSTNFHSTPDTAFVVEELAPAAALLRRQTDPAWAAARRELDAFLLKAGDAMITGGIHTPNHRWVVSAALARLNGLYPNSGYIKRVDQWLAETIDIDPDGQYTERSTTVYSPVVDRALLTVARILGRPELLVPVRRNLEMTLYYVHPDGEVVTEASRRQDRAQRGSMSRYYYSYRTMALNDGDGRFAAMARQIEREGAQHLTGELAAFLEEPDYRRVMPPAVALPDDYARVFRHSGLARIRRGGVSATILAEGTTIFTMRSGGAVLEAVRLASAFFGKGQFSGASLEAGEACFTLRQKLEGAYFQPLSPAQIANGEKVGMAANGVISVQGRSDRVRSNIQILETTIVVREEKRGCFALDFSIDGTDNVPVALEFAFRRGGRLEGCEAVADVKEAFILGKGRGRYICGDSALTFGPGVAEHSWTQLRGAVPKWDGLSVYLTGFTPFRHTLRITAGET